MDRKPISSVGRKIGFVLIYINQGIWSGSEKLGKGDEIERLSSMVMLRRLGEFETSPLRLDQAVARSMRHHDGP